MGRKAKIYDKDNVEYLFNKYGSINAVRMRTNYSFERIKEILIERNLIIENNEIVPCTEVIK